MIIKRSYWRAALLSIALSMAVLPAKGEQYFLDLIRVTSGSAQGVADAVTLTTVGTWVYDDSAGTVTLTGTQQNDFDLNPLPNNDLFSHTMQDVIFDLSAVSISGSAYACIEGQFGATVAASLCANNGFGPNFVNDTTMDYSTVPGIRFLGGDDEDFGVPQQLSDYAASLSGFAGGTLIIETPTWTANPGGAGLQLEFVTSAGPSLVDVPDVTGVDQATAAQAIQDAGLQGGTVSEITDPDVPRGVVISQDPAACSACLLPNSAVDLVVSLGPEPLVPTPVMLERLITDVQALDLPAASEFALNRWLRSSAVILRLCAMDVSEFSVPSVPGSIVQYILNIRAAICAADGVDLALTRLQWFIDELDTHVNDAGFPAQAVAFENAAQDIIAALQTAAPALGIRTIVSGGVERTYYLKLPDNYSRHGTAKPLLFAFHGTGGTYLNWFAGGFYGDALQNQVGNEAIMIFPQALPNANNVNQWNFEYDFQYFEDLLYDLRSLVVFDPNRVFVTGHSSGGGFTQEIGCLYGDVVRAIAPSAGALTSPECVGSVAILMLQSELDAIVPPTIVEPSRDFWVLYNGHEKDTFSDGVVPPCVDYTGGSSAYPVQWCLHDTAAVSGHGWWALADEAIWSFFSNLPYVGPTPDEPPGGGNDRVRAEFPATLTLTLRYPADIGEVWRGAAVLYPEGTRQPIFTAPLWFMNTDVDLSPALPGTEQTYTIPIQLFDSTPEAPLPGRYTVSVSVYVVGGGFPIPTTGIDHIALTDVDIVDKFSPIVIEEVLDVERLQSF